MLALALLLQSAQAPDASDVVVTARRGAALPPPMDAVAYFAQRCWNANRLTGRSSPPEDDPEWHELDGSERAAVRLDDPMGRVFTLADEQRGHTLVLKLERIARPAGVEETRCSLVVLGDDRTAARAAALSRLFGGPGTQRHVGRTDGTPALDGWRQTIWTGTPARRSQAWKAGEAILGKAGGTWTVVTDPHGFYAERDYIAGELKTQSGSRPVSIMSLIVSRRREGARPGHEVSAR